MRVRPLIACLLLGSTLFACAWDYEGHRAVNLIAHAALPADFPAFARTPAARERIAFLAGEADRWRNTTDTPLKHFNAPDHFLDFEDLGLYGLKPEGLSPFRYEFVAQLGAARATNAARLPPIDAQEDKDRTRALHGLLPWTITEYYGKLKSAFSYLKTFEELGTPDEIANAQANILYLMGVMGHFVGDATQPLHTTKHFNGWVGDNPQNYNTRRTFHAWIDGGYLNKVGLDAAALAARATPARARGFTRPSGANDAGVFPHVMKFLAEQHQLVIPLYEHEKAGRFSGNGTVGLEGKAFLEGQLLKGGQMLGDLWYSAWKEAGPDSYLKGQLNRRKLATDARAAEKKK